MLAKTKKKYIYSNYVKNLVRKFNFFNKFQKFMAKAKAKTQKKPMAKAKNKPIVKESKKKEPKKPRNVRKNPVIIQEAKKESKKQKDQKKQAKAEKKVKNVKKDTDAPEDTNQNEEKSSGGGYIFFKNPKYAKLAQKFVEASADEIKDLVEEQNFSLAEKIHIGNLMGGFSSKYVQEDVLPPNNTNLCYSAAQKEAYLKKYEELMENSTVNKLKELLVINEQAKTANKPVLCFRVADGVVLGRIPKCPSCLGGRFFIYINILLIIKCFWDL